MKMIGLFFWKNNFAKIKKVVYNLNMATITIPKNFITNDDLVIIPRKQYDSFLDIGKKWMQRLSEEKDTDEAIDIYKKEKKEGKLKILKSLASLSRTI